jgi:hypothetical protein
MAENKKSFIAYSDWNGMFKALPDEVAGKLIKHVFSYVNDENPSTDDYVINALFEQIKSTLKRDLVKWENERQQRVEAGRISAERRATKSNERSTVVNESTRNPTVSVSVSDNVSDNEKNKSKKEPQKRFQAPTLSEVEQYFFEQGYTKQSGRKAFMYYDSGNWKDSTGKQVKNWKQKMRGVWFKPENELNSTGQPQTSEAPPQSITDRFKQK